MKGRVLPRQVLPASLIVAVSTVWCSQSNGGLLTNGDFETSDLTGWSIFLTANGTLSSAAVSGAPGVTSFDVDGDAVATNSAYFTAGQSVFQGPPFGAGGGIFQSFNSFGGLTQFSIDIAATLSGDADNGDAGTFSLLIDNMVLDTHSFGSIAAGTTLRSTLSSSLVLTPGTHEFRVLITREYSVSQLAQRPPVIQYVDNAVAQTQATQPVPEPTSLALLGMGSLGLAGAKRLRRKSPLSA